MKYWLICSLITFSLNIYGQESRRDSASIAQFVNLDAFEISAGMGDFDVDDFINQVQKDTTFYQAFLNLKYFPHRCESWMEVHDKDEEVAARLERESIQYRDEENRRWVEIKEEKSKGKIKKKNGEWKYLTAEIYDDVFFPTQKEKVSRDYKTRNQSLEHSSKMEKHKAQLKKMLFNPGQEIENVPFIGDRMAIFSEEMVEYYEFRIFNFDWKDSIPCIGFSISTKEGEEDNTVIKSMTSYFDESTYAVMGRDYYLEYRTLLFDFDIHMNVENIVTDGEILPVLIQYDGWWDIPFKKPENIAFELKNSDYQVD